MTFAQWLTSAEKYVPQVMALEAGVPQTETVPAETASLNLGPLGTFQVSSPAFSVGIKKVG